MTDTIEHPRWGRIAALAAAGLLVVAALVFGLLQLGGDGSTAAPADASPSPTATATTSSTPTETSGTNDEGDGDVPGTSSDFNSLLPEAMNGQEAIDALGDKIEVVAKRNGKSVEELEELLLRDKTAHISPNGFIVYLDTSGPRG